MDDFEIEGNCFLTSLQSRKSVRATTLVARAPAVWRFNCILFVEGRRRLLP